MKSSKLYDVNDPFEPFGFGIMAYFQTMRNLMILLSGITVLLVPIMIIYSLGGALDSNGLNINLLHLEKTMLGNIG